MYEWNHYAKHECGEVVKVPFGNTSFLTSFGTLCPKCGKGWGYGIEVFTARYVYNAKLFNPLTWFSIKLEKQEKGNE